MQWRRPRADAQDLTQGFFAISAEKEYPAAFDPQKGRFRTFLRVCSRSRSKSTRTTAAP
jgi:hypothetical protein